MKVLQCIGRNRVLIADRQKRQLAFLNNLLRNERNSKVLLFNYDVQEQRLALAKEKVVVEECLLVEMLFILLWGNLTVSNFNSICVLLHPMVLRIYVNYFMNLVCHKKSIL